MPDQLSPRRRQADGRRHPGGRRARAPRAHTPGRRPRGRGERGQLLGLCRTRRALQQGLALYVASTAAGDVTALTEELRACGPDDDRKVELTSRLLLRWLQERDVLLVRLELELAAARDPELAAVLTDWRSRLVGLVAAIAAERGRDDAEQRAEALVASADGVLLAALVPPPAGAAPSSPRPSSG